MKNKTLWLAGSLLLMGSVVSHAGTLINPILAFETVPEPSSAVLGVGLLLVGLGVVRRRQKK